MTFGSLFSGIGGLDLGLERAGMVCRWQVELDDFCTQALERHWPDVPRYRDVRELDTGQLPRVDLIAGGFPCQPVSIAGKQRGQGDERWLWPAMARVVRDLRPRFVPVENVAGLVRRGIGDVLGDLAALGYDAEWDLLRASDLGAPHRRERVFLVAYPVCVGLERHPTLPRAFEEAQRAAASSDWWASEPDVPRVADGFPDRVAVTRAYGNAVVPQVAEVIGRAIMEIAT